MKRYNLQLPCKNCAGHGWSCTHMLGPDPQRKETASVGKRTQHRASKSQGHISSPSLAHS
jgi:hypothetical protein